MLASQVRKSLALLAGHYQIPGRSIKLPSLLHEQAIVAHVDYCLAEPAPRTCKIQLQLHYLITVIVTNAAKVLCFITIAVCGGHFEPLASIGDAMRSFLKWPCAITQDAGLVSRKDVKDGKWKGIVEGNGCFTAGGVQVESLAGARPYPWQLARRRFWLKVSPGA